MATTTTNDRTTTSPEVPVTSPEMAGSWTEVDVKSTSSKGERGATVILSQDAAARLAKWALHYYPNNAPSPGRIAEEMLEAADALRAADGQRAETPAQRLERLTGRKTP